jgi:hypothetical protein
MRGRKYHSVGLGTIAEQSTYHNLLEANPLPMIRNSEMGRINRRQFVRGAAAAAALPLALPSVHAQMVARPSASWRKLI